MTIRRIFNSRCFNYHWGTSLATIVLVCFSSLAQADMIERKATVYSVLSKQSLHLKVYVPSDYEAGPGSRYPVLVTTAGRSRLPMLMAQIDWLSHVDFGPMPKVIVVTLPAIDFAGAGDKFAAASGSIDKLTADILESEVLPYIERQYRTQPYRLIEGFSSWGNFPLYVFRNYPDLFNAYLALGPALELDESGLVDSFLTGMDGKAYNNKYLYLSFATFNGQDAEFFKLRAGLEALTTGSKLSLKVEDMREQNYIASPLIGLTHAVTHLFADRAPQPKQFEDAGYEGVMAHFNRLKHKYGYEIDAEASVIDLSFHYAEQGQKQKALDTIGKVVDLQSENPILLLRLAKIETQVGMPEQARVTLSRALQLALNKGNEEQSSYIRRQLEALTASQL